MITTLDQKNHPSTEQLNPFGKARLTTAHFCSDELGSSVYGVISYGDKNHFSLPLILDGANEKAISYRLSQLDGGLKEYDSLTDSQKAAIGIQLLSTSKPVLTIFNDVLNHHLLLPQEAITTLLSHPAIATEVDYNLALVGPSKSGKSHLATAAAIHGVTVANLDVKNVLAAYLSQPATNWPLTEPSQIPKNIPKDLSQLQQLVDQVAGVQPSPGHHLTLWDTGGFSTDVKSRPFVSPLDALNRSAEIILLVAPDDISDEQKKDLIHQNPGLGMSITRQGFYFNSSGDPKTVAQDFIEMLDGHQQIFMDHALRMRRSIAFTLGFHIQDPELKINICRLANIDN
jgi:hypothetical protein